MERGFTASGIPGNSTSFRRVFFALLMAALLLGPAGSRAPVEAAPASQTGTVTISGHVTAASLANARAAIGWPGGGMPEVALDAGNNYSFTIDQGLTFTVAVRADGYAPTAQSRIATTSQTIDFDLDALNPNTISGSVSKSDGQPLNSAQVIIFPPGSGWASTLNLANGASAPFSFKTGPGNWTLRAQESGFLGPNTNVMAGASGVALTLSPAVTISGRVTASVALSHPRVRMEYNSMETSPDGAGSYSFAAPQNSSVTLRAKADGYAPYSVTLTTGTTDFSQDFNLDTLNPYTISGTVSRPSGTFNNTRIQIDHLPKDWSWESSVYVTGASPAAYSFRASAGMWALRAYEPGLYSPNPTVTVDAPHTVVTADLSLSSAAVVSGRVLPAGVPSAWWSHVRVEWNNNANSEEAQAGAGAFYSLTLPQNTTFTVRVRGDGYAPYSTTLTTGTADLPNQDFNLDTLNPYTVSGTMSNSDGQPLAAGTYVQIAPQGGNWSSRVNPSGTPAGYSFKASGGAWQVQAMETGYTNSWTNLTLDASHASATANLTLTPTVALAGTVTAASLVGGRVRAEWPGGGPEKALNPDGSFSFDVPMNTTVTLRVGADGYAPYSTTVAVGTTSPPVQSFNLDTLNPYIISGNVTRPSGALNNTRIRIWPWNTPWYWESSVYVTGASPAPYSFKASTGTWGVRAFETGFYGLAVSAMVDASHTSVVANISLVPGVVVSGRVLPAGVSSSFGNQVRAEWNNNANSEGATARSSDGYYSFSLPQNTTFAVRFRQDGYAPYSTTLTTGTVDMPNQDFNLDTLSPYTVSGTVSNSDGLPLASGTFVQIGPQGGWFSRVNPSGTPAGYSFKASAGAFQVQAVEIGYSNSGTSLTLDASHTSVTANLTLTPVVALTGGVTAASLVGGRVRAEWPGNSPEKPLNADGSFSFDVPTNTTVTLRVRADGYAPYSTTVTVGATAPPAQNFNLDTLNPYTIGGTVTRSVGTFNNTRIQIGPWNAPWYWDSSVYLNGASPATYTFKASAGNWGLRAYETGFYGNWVGATVGSSQTSATANLTQVPGMTISGRVLPAGVPASLGWHVRTEWNNNANSEGGNARSSDGFYSFMVPQNTTLTVRVRGDGYAPYATTLTTGTADLPNQDFNLDTLNPYTVSGTVSNSDGLPLVGGTFVQIGPQGGSWFSRVNPTGTPAGYSFKASAGAFQMQAVETGYTPSGTPWANVTMDASHPSVTANLTLSPNVTVSGRITAASLAGGRVMIDWPNNRREVSLNADGSYSLSVPQNTSFNLYARADGYGAVLRPISTTTTNLSGIDLDLDERNPYTVTGTVSNFDGTNFASGARVTILGYQRPSWTSYFYLPGNASSAGYSFKVGDGAWRLGAEESGYSIDRAATVGVSSSSPSAAANLTLYPAANIAGVITAGGVPQSGASVSVETPQGDFIRSYRTSGDGRYSLPVPRNGSYQLQVDVNFYARVTLAPLAVGTTDLTQNVDVAAYNPYTITANISNFDGSNLSGASLYLWPAQGILPPPGPGTALAAAPSAGVTLHVPAGSWKLRVNEAGYLSPVPRVWVGPGRPNAVQNLVLSSAAGLDEQRIQLHAGWNWVSFAVAPSTGAGASNPIPTAFFRDYSGTLALNGVEAPVGTVVEAFNPRGDLVGSTTVTTPGWYGYLRVYGQDPQTSSTNSNLPGMLPGEEIDFRVNGYVAYATVPALWQSDFTPAQVDLRSARELPVMAALSGIMGAYDFVLGEEGTYSTTPPYPGANRLVNLQPGKGYFLRMTQPRELVLRGQRVPANAALPLSPGWRWVGYLPEAAQDLPGALGSIVGRYDFLLGETGTYSPLAQPFLNSMTRMQPGGGYLIRMIQPGALTYGSGVGASRLVPAAAPTSTQAATPTMVPTATPTVVPAVLPTTVPTVAPTAPPVSTATALPGATPTPRPATPTLYPTVEPATATVVAPTPAATPPPASTATRTPVPSSIPPPAPFPTPTAPRAGG